VIEAPPALVLLRVAIAFVFVTEGLQKFLSPEVLASAVHPGRIPFPELTAPFVGGVEILAAPWC